MTIKVNNKEYTIKFGYEPTLKSRLLSRAAEMAVSAKENSQGNMQQIENMLMFIPEMVLVGLQKFHSDEFGYNLDTKDGYEEAKNKVFELVGNYVDSGDVDVTDFFATLQEEMTSNGFLKKMFEREIQQATPNRKKKAEN